MFFSLKRRSSATASEWKDCKKTLHYLETWALRAVLTPSRSPLLLLLLWPPQPLRRDLRLLGQQDHPSSLSPTFVDTQKHGCSWLPFYPILLPPSPPLLHYLPTHTQAHPLHPNWEHRGWFFFNLKLVCLARASNLLGVKPTHFSSTLS